MISLIGNATAQRKMPLAGILACALTASAAIPAMAAPGDSPAPLQVREIDSADQPMGGGLSYLNIAGSAFHPLDNTTTYSYPGSGCIAKTGGGANYFVHRLILPQGTTLNYLRLYYYKTSASNISAYFNATDGAGGSANSTTVSSGSGTSGYQEALSGLVGFTVDHFNSSINILVNLSNQNDETIRFCGVRVAYRPDRIFANGFDPNLL